jgi:hypothetical protein
MLYPFFNLTIPLTIKIYELKNDSCRSDSLIFWAIVAGSRGGRRFSCGIGRENRASKSFFDGEDRGLDVPVGGFLIAEGA